MNNIAWLRKHNLDFYVEIPAVKIKTEFWLNVCLKFSLKLTIGLKTFLQKACLSYISNTIKIYILRKDHKSFSFYFLLLIYCWAVSKAEFVRDGMAVLFCFIFL